jgi:2-dehydro-3-deoxygalactonokinase
MTGEGAIVADWIAADWGTSRLRVWAMGADGAPLAAAAADTGMGGLAPGEYDAALLALVGGWLRADRVTPVVVCGMAGAREGWAPAPYADIATPLARIAADPAIPVADPRLSVRILPGLRQMTPPDVMRGEETQLAGLLAMEPDFDGVAVLPGTHSKWARVVAGRVGAFRSFMTGEIFALLASRSVLRHSMPADMGGLDEAAFRAAVLETSRRPEQAAADVFGVRAASLLGQATANEAAGRLSGLLIGAELAAAAALFGDAPATLIGEPALCDWYGKALALTGRAARTVDPASAVLAGLTAAHAHLFGDRP